MKPKYTEVTWRSGHRFKADAQEAYQQVERLRQGTGYVTAQQLVEDSRSSNAPLHEDFEWEDEVAAERHREWQARNILAAFEVTITKKELKKPITTRLYVSSADHVGYGEVIEVLNQPEGEFLLAQAQRELTAFREKYKNLKELSDVFKAIDKIA